MVRAATLLTPPLAVSVVLVNVFFFPGATDVLVRLGLFTATGEGLRFALEVVLRLFVISGAVALFYRTTDTGDLTLDLERRGVATTRVRRQRHGRGRASDGRTGRRDRRRSAAHVGSTLGRRPCADPGHPPDRGARGPRIDPEVEERTLALEARGFSRPGRRTLLRVLPDRLGSGWRAGSCARRAGIVVLRAAGAPI